MANALALFLELWHDEVDEQKRMHNRVVVDDRSR
jgi:hypothetical protein